MKIHRVEMTAFGPFKDEQVVDFEQFVDDGLYLISGKTGAGKTSILDAICFGLYGSAPRYEDVAGAEATYRSHYAALTDKTEVLVEFSTATDRYRVVRTPEYLRPAKRGGGLTKEKASATLFKLEAGEWVGIVSGISQVENALSAIRPLTRNQFLQVMLLAQNRFQEFLVANTEDRNKVLQQLFQTRRFEDYESELKLRRSALAQSVAENDKAIAGYLDQIATQLSEADLARWPTLQRPETSGLPSAQSNNGQLAVPAALTSELEEVIGNERDRVATAEAIAVAAENQAAKANIDLNRLTEARRRQEQRAAAQAELAAIAEMAAEEAGWQRSVRYARRAEQAWPWLLSAEAAQSAKDQAVAAVKAASRGVDPKIAAATLAELRIAGRELTEQAGALASDLARERELPTLVAAADEAAEQLARHDQQAAETIEQAAQLERQIGQLAEQCADARAKAGTLPQLTDAVSRVTGALDAAKAIEHLADQRTADRAHLASCIAAAADAEQARQKLWVRRIAEYAGTVAEELTAGQPCPVCGALEHPNPAEPVNDPVTEADMTRAEEEVAKATAAADELAKALGELDQKLVELNTRAEGIALDVWEVELTKALAAQSAAQAAETELAEATELRREAEEEMTRARDAIGLQAAAREELNRRQASAATAVDLAKAQVELAKGSFESVAARHDDALERVAALNQLITAREAQENAQRLFERANQELATALAEQQFADSESVRQARQSEAAIAELTDRIDKLAARRSAADALLSQSDLADLPVELVEVAPAAERLRLAQEHLVAANQSLGASRKRAEVISDAVSAAQACISTAAKLREQYAVVERLANTVQGKAPNERNMRLVDFVLAAELEDIAEAANLRLKTMSHGRYELQQDDTKTGNSRAGLGLKVLDLHTGELRTTNSLSGGEKFLASLALALGLAETVSNRAGGIALDTLFIDEGFGSLDPETLEVAMATLDELRTGGRTVGVISHVPAMHEAIAAKLEVEVVEGGWSRIRAA